MQKDCAPLASPFKKIQIQPSKQTNKPTNYKKQQQDCLENLCLLIWQPWLGWVWFCFFFFPPCFLVSWCQQEILCLTGTTISGNNGGDELCWGDKLPPSITCPAPRRGDGGRRWQPLRWKWGPTSAPLRCCLLLKLPRKAFCGCFGHI